MSLLQVAKFFFEEENNHPFFYYQKDLLQSYFQEKILPKRPSKHVPYNYLNPYPNNISTKKDKYLFLQTFQSAERVGIFSH